MADTLATAFVRIMPDWTGFGGEMRQGLRRQGKQEVEVDVKADTRAMDRQITQQAQETGKKGGKLLSGGMAVGLAAAGAATAGVGAALGVVGIGLFKVTSKASDLNETISKTRAIFGKSADGILEWSKSANRSLGLTRNEALSAVSGFGDLFQQLKIAPKSVQPMSQGLTTLAADLASFSNADITDVIDAQSAAFRGEYDSLQRFIPNINAARVEQEALRQTHKKSASDLTAAEKAMATYAIMMKDTTRAQGDFQRTSGGMANQQRILKAQWEELQTTIGQKFLPIGVKLATWGNDKLIPFLERTWQSVQGVGKGFSMLREAFSTGKTEDEGTRWERLGLFLRGAWEQVQKLVQWWKNDLNPALREAKDDILPELIKFWEKVSGAFRGGEGDGAKFRAVLSAIGVVITDAVIPAASLLAKLHLKALGDAFKAIGWAINEVVIPGLGYFMRGALRAIGAVLTAAEKGFGWIPGLGGKLKDAKRAFDRFQGEVNAALNGIKDRNVKVTATAVISGDTWRLKQGDGTLGPRMRAEGGSVHGPGGAKGDRIPTLLSDDEHVISNREVKGAGGHAAIEAMRAQWRRRANGGRVTAQTNAAPLRAGAGRLDDDLDVVGASWGARLRRAYRSIWEGGPALQWAKSQQGKPYVWGGVGPGGYDCSGFMSAIWNVIQGRSPYSRRFTTGSFPAAGWASGPGNFMIGSRRGSPGHMAGTLYGTNVESRGGDGVVVGPGARGARSSVFDGVWHLQGFAKGGRVQRRQGDPPWDLIDPEGKYAGLGMRAGVFDKGGWLPPRSAAINLSRKPEAVLTQEQLSGAGGNHYHFHNHGVVTTRDVEDWFTGVQTEIKRKGRR